MTYQISQAIADDACQSLNSIMDFMRWTASEFERANIYFGHGTDNPWDEACALVLAALKIPEVTDAKLLDCQLTMHEKRLVLDFIKARVNDRKPLAYITHQMNFAGISFYVDERALVPRSPIAELIEQQFYPWLSEPPTAILDLCTGGGCIALASAVHCPDATVIGSDISAEALQVAQINLEQLDLAEHVTFIESDLFNNIPKQEFDLIVSNPPYVDALDMSILTDEYKHEPELGLASGNDGLDITRKILATAADYLSEQGILIVEVGNSAPALEQAYPDVAFTWIEFERGGDGVFMLTKQQLLEIANS